MSEKKQPKEKKADAQSAKRLLSDDEAFEMLQETQASIRAYEECAKLAKLPNYSEKVYRRKYSWDVPMGLKITGKPYASLG